VHRTVNTFQSIRHTLSTRPKQLLKPIRLLMKTKVGNVLKLLTMLQDVLMIFTNRIKLSLKLYMKKLTKKCVTAMSVDLSH